jgi:hypothetical protein
MGEVNNYDGSGYNDVIEMRVLGSEDNGVT